MKRFHWITVVAFVLGPSAPSAEPTCTRDDEVVRYLGHRDDIEHVLLVGYLHGQLDETLIARLAAEVAAWEARVIRLCSEPGFLTREIHLLNFDSQALGVRSIPGWLLAEMGGQAGLRLERDFLGNFTGVSISRRDSGGDAR